METIMPKKNFIFTIVLITALVIFGMHVFAISAEDGGSGETVVEQTEPTPEPDVIVTGDAVVVVEAENDVNTNIVESEEIIGESEFPVCGEFCGSTEIDIDNEAEVENDVVVEGNTGDNEIEEKSKCDKNSNDAVIVTGNVNIYVGLVNTVNSNIINSKLSDILYNIFNAQGDIDVPDEVMDNPEGCGQGQCEDVDIENEGSIDNDVEIDASSGNNKVKSKNGDAIITTGDVNVVTNIFNVLNSNIIGSNWVNLIINIFGDWTGDLVLPGEQKMQDFVENPSSSCSTGCSGEDIDIDNEGGVENNVEVNANTGDNSASGDDSTIITGNANVETNVLNVVNNNIIHNNWFFMAINNFGNWQGNVFSMPPGFKFREDFRGLKIFNSGPSEESEENSGGGALNLVEDNSGSIENGVIINVDTGNNSIESENGSAGIGTGDANVLTNLTNILNSNVVGSNWLLGMINIFGNWQGDVAFGRPDLWIGESAETLDSPAQPDNEIIYTITYINKGDAAATGITLIDNFDEKFMAVTDPGSGVVVDNPGEVQWDLGRVGPGESGSVTYTVTVKTDIHYGYSNVINQAEINSFEEDNNKSDNIESLSVQVYRGNPTGTSPVLIYPDLPELQIQKFSNPEGSVYAGNFVDYEIYIKNNSDSQAYRVVVTDVLKNGEPEPLSTNVWNLDYVFPNETITIDYAVYIGADVEPGLYTNIAKVSGFDVWGDAMSSNEASVTIEVLAPLVVENLEEEVASVSAEAESSAPLEQLGNVGIGGKLGLAKSGEPEVLGEETVKAKHRIPASVYSEYEFDDWIFMVLLVLLISFAFVFTVLYLNDNLSKKRKKALNQQINNIVSIILSL
jgi:uncharacterized repeat protein (TIGR01451 family)